MTPYVTLVALLIVFWAVGAYQRLLRQRKQCRTAFSQVEAQAERRHELIPPLVAACRMRMPEEGAALDAVLAADKATLAATAYAARNALGIDALAPLIEAEAMLESALHTMFVLKQHYSEAASDLDLHGLIDELSALESRMAFARQVYNEAASHYNAARVQFPSSVIAVVFAFTPVASLPATGTQQAGRP